MFTIAVSTTVPVFIIHMSLYDLATNDPATSNKNPNSMDVKPGMIIFNMWKSCLTKRPLTCARFAFFASDF